MRVAIIAESFLPHMNGVTNSVLRILEHLDRRGHQALVLAPAVSRARDERWVMGFPVRRLRSLPLPTYPEVRMNLVTDDLIVDHLRDFEPDVMHLASPFLVGPPAVRASAMLQVPVVASFQTDVPAFTTRYSAPFVQRWAWNRLRGIHQACDVNLVPSRATLALLQSAGVGNLQLLGRGVDSTLFHPRQRSTNLHRDLGGEVLLGAVGRLAPEKSWEDLGAVADVPGTRLVFIGDGPRRKALERRFPRAAFLGFLTGHNLAAAIATMDICINTGLHETFCQSVQEALSCGVPVVAAGAGGPLDLISSSRTGWLYEPGDMADLRNRVVDLAGDGGKRRAMGRAARTSVLQRTWSAVGDQLLATYQRVIDGRVTVKSGTVEEVE